MLFGIGADQKKHIVHIEFKQWSNNSVKQLFSTGVFEVTAFVGGQYQILSHPSQQAYNYHRNMINYVPAVSEKGTELKGFAYCCNYTYEGQPNNGIDFVTIVTPNATHYDVAKCFLTAGINVFCEKPLCFTVEQAEDLKAIAEAKNLLLGVAYGYTGYTMSKVMELSCVSVGREKANAARHMILPENFCL